MFEQNCFIMKAKSGAIFIIYSILLMYMYWYCCAETLNQLYTSDTTLKPLTHYTIDKDVQVAENVIFHVPNNTNISFTGNFTFTVLGSLIIGCEDADTVNDHNVGITDPNLSILVCGNNKQGTILIESGGNATICNTKFSNLYQAIRLNSEKHFILDNCEFENNNFCLNIVQKYAISERQITDNIFYNSEHGINGATQCLIENNIFLDIAYKGVNVDCCNGNGTNIINNTFVNDTSDSYHSYGSAIYSSGYNNNITLNTFINFTNGLILNGQNNIIKYNEFIDNEIAIIIQTGYKQHINYNNFISNQYNIQLKDNQNQQDVHHNYNGVTGDSSSPQLIGDKMIDFCDSNGYNGIITFWPYFVQELYLKEINNLPPLYTFTFTDCTSITSETGTLLPGQPTRSPTSTPVRTNIIIINKYDGTNIINNTFVNDTGFQQPPFLVGKVIAIFACVVCLVPFAILFNYIYEKHFEWRRENPSIYLFIYNHTADIIMWTMLCYWCYIAVTFQSYYTDYCISFNPTYAKDASPHDAVPIFAPDKPSNFFSICDTYHGGWNEYDDNVWPVYATEYRLKQEISTLITRYFAILILFCVQQLAVPIGVCILVYSDAEFMHLIVIEGLSIRSCCFDFWVKRFYEEFYINRIYLYQMSCWCCLNKMFAPNIIILFVWCAHAIFITEIVTVAEIISALDCTEEFYGQGMKGYEFYSLLVLLVEQFMVQMVYMFPCDKYVKEKEWRRGTQYLLNKTFPKVIVNLINEYNTHELRLEYDIPQSWQRKTDLTTKCTVELQQTKT